MILLFEVSNDNTPLVYEKQDLYSEVLQNIRMILNTYKTEVPLMRDFAMSPDLIDLNYNQLKNRIFSDLINICRRYEPRAILKQLKLNVEDNDIEKLHSNQFSITLFLEISS